LKLKDFKPVPQGDGQTLSVQAQAGQYFKNYSLSFTEPWLFGTRPTALSVGLNHSSVNYTDMYGASQKLNIFSASAGLNKLLNWPDNYFSLYTGIAFKVIISAIILSSLEEQQYIMVM
jgi:outer membrane protein insertion porin family